MKVLRSNYFPLFVLLLVVFIANSASSQSPSTIKILYQDTRFSILTKAIEKAGLMDIFDEKSSITLFAPTNEAFEDFFEKMGVKSIDELSAEQLKPILLFHIAGYKIPSAGLYPGTIETLNKNAGLSVKIVNEKVILNNESNIITKDIKTTNGYIHAIDRVMIPHIRSNKESGSGHC
jgi:transforming growth factor-beta-induced protein